MERTLNKIELNDNWYMEYKGEMLGAGSVPFSMYDTLLKNRKMDDPYYGENEKKALEYARKDYTFVKKFEVDEETYAWKNPMIIFEMLDTLASVYLNGEKIGEADNMHRIWRMDASGRIKLGQNELKIVFASPVEYADKMISKRHIWGQDEITLPGYQYIRKAHYMFGWDWGPCLPDMGVYRDVYMYDAKSCIVSDIDVKQTHWDNKVELEITPQITSDKTAAFVEVVINAPENNGNSSNENIIYRETKEVKDPDEQISYKFEIDNPLLWWPNGLGKQPLYKVMVNVYDSENVKITGGLVRIGLRTIEVSKERDEWGREFCFKVNGIKIFTMGSDYIPEDGIIPRIKNEYTYNLLKMCKDSNFNCIRVWGGGYYPGDYFYDLCDEMGFIVWQDHMFACATYLLDDHMRENIRIEVEQNVQRLRNHPCIGIWCGNNEMATAWECWGLPQEEDLIEYYDEMFNHIIKDATHKYDPVTEYWPSSPFSADEGTRPNDFNDGDVHYWDVWHGLKPIDDAMNYYFRFCSEYGFESLPDIKTLRTVLYPQDFNLYSPSLEAHHKCTDGQHKLMYYMGQFMRMPGNFEQVIYGSQVMQAEAIRTNVEHMRRNRGRCMGSVYWQLNDSNPTVSWSSVDYYRNPKALQYFAKEFYAPVLLSAQVKGTVMKFNISNESHNDFEGIIEWFIKDNDSKILKQGKINAYAEAFCAQWFDEIDFSELIGDETEKRSKYLEYKLISNGKCLTSKTQLFVPFKYYGFEDPKLQLSIEEMDDRFVITVKASKFAKDVFLSLENAYAYMSENWFDIHAGESKTVPLYKRDLEKGMDLQTLEKEIKIMSMYDVGK